MSATDGVQAPGEAERAAPPANRTRRGRPEKHVVGVARPLAVLTLGVIFPILLLWQAYASLSVLKQDIVGATMQTDLVKMFGNLKTHTTESTLADDYALFSVLYVEHSNKLAIINKQLLKVVIIQIGFSVVSVGMMFIILGIRDGGADISSDAGGIKFDFKIGSTGLMTFVIGAAMATGGALLPNEYSTVGIPGYLQVPSGDKAAASHAATTPSVTTSKASGALPTGASAEADDHERTLLDRYHQCNTVHPHAQALDCFYEAFRDVYKEKL